MTAAKKPFLVPYTSNGSILAYPESTFSHFAHRETGEVLDTEVVRALDWRERDHVRTVYAQPEMRPNDIWSGTLRLDDFQRGRSAARFIWYADGDPVYDRRTYPMFMVDMLELVKTQGVQPGGLVHGRWNVAKRGANFGIKLVTE